MSLDLIDVKSFLRIALQEATKKIRCICREARKDLNVSLCDLLHHLVTRLFHLDSLLEGVDATDHLVKKHAKTPPIDSEVVADILDNFRRQIFWSSTERVCQSFLRLLDL